MAITATNGIVIELQRDCLDTSVPVSSILRKARLIASKLDLDTLQEWMNSELNGYSCSLQDLPDHRKGAGQPKFKNPYHGWCPIMTDNDFFGKTVRTVFLRQSVAELEELARGDGHLVMQYDPVIQEEMQKQLPVRMECALHFSKSMIAAALDYVRNTILDWAAELERQGVIGEGMSFDADDKREARSVTNNIYGSNVGVLGSVAGNADSKEFYSAGRDISITKVNELVKQIREVIPALPDNIQQSILPSLKLLEEPDQPPGKIRATLSSIKAVLEGAAGNLAASGILAAIASL